MSDCYCADGMSRKKLRECAKSIRKFLGLEKQIYFPVVELLDILAVKLGNEFKYEIIEDDELPPEQHACTDVINGIVKIKESVYLGANNGNGRDRMTITHELAHFFLIAGFGVNLYQIMGNRQIPPYKSPEWQAKCLAAELMISKDLVGDLSVFDIEIQCGVSHQAAEIQYDHFHEEDE
ncbi:MAG: ImmA/IrrE family metallo-endopeptidase [Acidaminococcaceae bacterium]|nr:ImmA/IrrE family metallo-endopeptidase [Acidaminococcaceae bacterium]